MYQCIAQLEKIELWATFFFKSCQHWVQISNKPFVHGKYIWPDGDSRCLDSVKSKLINVCDIISIGLNP